MLLEQPIRFRSLYTDRQFGTMKKYGHVEPISEYGRVQKQIRLDGLLLRCSGKMQREKAERLRQKAATPGPERDFKMHILTRDLYENPGIPPVLDYRNFISLACLNEINELDKPDERPVVSKDESNFLELYLTKLPILCINKLRLSYTLAAFAFRARVNRDDALDALNFYLRTDIGRSNRLRNL